MRFHINIRLNMQNISHAYKKHAENKKKQGMIWKKLLFYITMKKSRKDIELDNCVSFALSSYFTNEIDKDRARTV